MPAIPKASENNSDPSEANTALEEGNSAREITLTDHLNKKLLSSFLERINTQNIIDKYNQDNALTERKEENNDFSS